MTLAIESSMSTPIPTPVSSWVYQWKVFDLSEESNSLGPTISAHLMEFVFQMSDATAL